MKVGRGDPYIAVGSTGPEAISAELKEWFRGPSQLRGPMLKLKMRITQVAKIVAAPPRRFAQ